MISGSMRVFTLLAATLSANVASAGQAPGAASDPDVGVSHHDRVYAAEQFSNTVSVTDPASNTLLGVIRLGDAQPGNLSPLYKGQVLVHGMGFSPDHRTLSVVAIGTNAVVFVDTATNTVRHVTYVGRAPHEAFFTPDGNEVWVTVRGENYVDVLDGHTYAEKTRITVPNGPGMTIFSPDGQYGYVCSSFVPETDVIAVADHSVVGKVVQASPFCPNIAATPDGKQVWLTLKDTGKAEVFDARPPFAVLKTLDTGPITNHVNIVRNAKGQFAYLTIGGLNEVKVFRTDTFEQVATIPVGDLPHGIWPSGDGTRVYVGLENADKVVVIDTLANNGYRRDPDRTMPAGADLCPRRVPGRKRRQPPAARSRGNGGSSLAGGAQRRQRQSADDRRPLRPRSHPGSRGERHRPRAKTGVRAGAVDTGGRIGIAAVAGELHDQPRRRRDRQRSRPYPSGR